MFFQAKKITLKDSKLFLPMALKAVPKAFGLTDRAKGFYPYLFDTQENAHYVGDWPAIEYYDPDSKSPEERQALLEWHAQQVGKVSCLANENCYRLTFHTCV